MPGRGWNHNLQYHRLLLGSVPRDCGHALDVGCGEGEFVRALGAVCGQVTGIDLDVTALEPGPVNTVLLEGDVLTYPFTPASFDFISAIAVLHHVPLELGLARFGSLLRPGGTLAVLGLYRHVTAAGQLWAAMAYAPSCMLRLLKGEAAMRSAVSRPEQTLREVRDAAAEQLPGAQIVRRLFFRYTLIWRKGPAS